MLLSWLTIILKLKCLLIGKLKTDFIVYNTVYRYYDNSSYVYNNIIWDYILSLVIVVSVTALNKIFNL